MRYKRSFAGELDTFSWGHLQVTHIQLREKGSNLAKFSPCACGSASAGFIISQRWVASPVSHPLGATQKEEAMPGGQALEAGHPHKDKAQLNFQPLK